MNDENDLDILYKYPNPWRMPPCPHPSLRGWKAIASAAGHMLMPYHATSGRFISIESAQDWCEYDPDSIRTHDDSGAIRVLLPSEAAEWFRMRDGEV